jgi:flagellar biogenesis protein FliO
MSPLAQYVTQTVLTLLVIALLAWLIVAAGRRVGLYKDEGGMRLRGRLTLEGRRSVYLVEVAGRVLVLGASEHGLTKLSELPSDALLPDEEPPPRGFSDVLARLRGSPPARTEPKAAQGEPPKSTAAAEASVTNEGSN